MAAHNLAWMPTLSGDTKVLATDKVRFQGQEVAAVIATDPYVAHDALELIDVDYEILPVIVTRSRRWPTTPRSSVTTRRGRPTTSSTVGGRRRRGDRGRLRRGRRGRGARHLLPALAPRPAGDVR